MSTATAMKSRPEPTDAQLVEEARAHVEASKAQAAVPTEAAQTAPPKPAEAAPAKQPPKSTDKPVLAKEFMVERQGRAFCLYAGILDLAHRTGLRSIKTEIIQIPAEANNRVAICYAVVMMRDPDGSERSFAGIGDAAPNNVAPAMQVCLLRMAETRAKARALRDAVNIGIAAYEELGEEDKAQPETPYQARSDAARDTRPAATRTTQPRPAPAAPRPAAAQETASRREATPRNNAERNNAAVEQAAAGGITRVQEDAITSLSRRKGVPVPAMIGWTIAQASAAIAELQKK